MAEAKAPDPSQDWGAIDIFLFSNGQEYSPPRKYHLTADELNWWDKTLSHLARTQYGGEKMHTTVELYSLNGKRVQSPMELRDGVTYVAVSPNEKFVQAGYEQYLIKASRSREKRERRRAAGLDVEDEMKTYLPEPKIPKKEAQILECEGVPDSENSLKNGVKTLAPIKTNGEKLDNIDKLSKNLKASLGSVKPERKRLSSPAYHRSSSLDKPRLSSVTSSPTPVRKSSASTSRKESSSTPANLKLAKPIDALSGKSSNQPKLPHFPIFVKHTSKNGSNSNAVIDENNKNTDLIVISDPIGNTDSEVTSISIDTETAPKKVIELENENLRVDKKYRKSIMHDENNFLTIQEENSPNKDKNSPEDQVTWATLLKAKNADKKSNCNIPNITKNRSREKPENGGDIISENIVRSKTFSTIDSNTIVTNIKCNTPPPSLVSKPLESAERKLKQKLCSKLGSKQNYDDTTTISGQFLESLNQSLTTDSSELHKNVDFSKVPIGFDGKYESARASAQAPGIPHAKSKKKRSVSESVLTNTTLEQLPLSFNSNDNNEIISTMVNVVNPEKIQEISPSHDIADNSTGSNLIPRYSSNLKWAPASVYSASKKVTNDTPRKGSKVGTETKKQKDFKRSGMIYDFASPGSEAKTNTKGNSNLPNLKTVKPKVDDKGSQLLHQPKSKHITPLNTEKQKPKPVPNLRPSQLAKSVKPVPTINISQILENTIRSNEIKDGSKNQNKQGQVLKSLNPLGPRVMSNQAANLAVGNQKHTSADKNKVSSNLKPNSTTSNTFSTTNDKQNMKNAIDRENNKLADSKEDIMFNKSNHVGDIYPPSKIDMLLLPELSDKKYIMKDFLQDGTTTTEPFVTVLTNAEILNLQLNLEVKNKDGTVTAKVNSQRSHSATDIKLGTADEAMGQSKSMDSINYPPHICCQRNQQGQCACCDHFDNEDAGRNILVDQDTKTYYILVPVTAFTKKCNNQQKSEEIVKQIAGRCCCGDDEQTPIKENNDMTEKEVQHSTSLSKINVVTCTRETSTTQVVAQDKAQNCNAQTSKTSIISQAISKKVSICSEGKIITSQTGILIPERKSSSTSMGITKQDKSVQTDTCNLIVSR